MELSLLCGYAGNESITMRHLVSLRPRSVCACCLSIQCLVRQARTRGRLGWITALCGHCSVNANPTGSEDGGPVFRTWLLWRVESGLIFVECVVGWHYTELAPPCLRRCSLGSGMVSSNRNHHTLNGQLNMCLPFLRVVQRL